MRTIKSAIESVLSQSHSEIEYIVIDGGSNDGTLDILQNYRSKISVLVSEPDLGIYDAMNKGINLATGDVIGILNSDDIYSDDGVLSVVATEFIENVNIDGIYGNLLYVNKFNVDFTVRTWKSKKYYKSFFEDGNVPPHPSLFLRREVYIKYGLFSLEFKLASDYDFMLRVFKKFEITSLFIDRNFVKMRLGGATNKSFLNIINGNIEIFKSWDHNGFNFPIFLIPRRIIKRLFQYL